MTLGRFLPRRIRRLLCRHRPVRFRGLQMTTEKGSPVALVSVSCSRCGELWTFAADVNVATERPKKRGKR